MSADVPVAVIGAGPYGLSVAAHLSARGVPHRVFGRPMSLWSEHMPRGMYLKSEGFASSLSDPRKRYTLAEFCREKDVEYADIGTPVRLDTFTAYGKWFQARAVPELEQREVRCVRADRRGFEMTLDDGERFTAGAVVLATGMLPYAHLPSALRDLPPCAVSHPAAHQDLSMFRDRDVTVVGAGQSALESAALLAEAGASTRVVARTTGLVWNVHMGRRSVRDRVTAPLSGLGTGWRLFVHVHAPDVFRHLPPDRRLRIVRGVLGPAGAWWLRARVDDRIPVMLGHRVVGARLVGDAVLLELADSHGRSVSLVTDHVLAATGYRVDVHRLPFLDPTLTARLSTVAGSPALDGSFQSSVPGLFFVGLPAAMTFGPLLRFVYGTGFTAHRVARAAPARS